MKKRQRGYLGKVSDEVGKGIRQQMMEDTEYLQMEDTPSLQDFIKWLEDFNDRPMDLRTSEEKYNDAIEIMNISKRKFEG